VSFHKRQLCFECNLLLTALSSLVYTYIHTYDTKGCKLFGYYVHLIPKWCKSLVNTYDTEMIKAISSCRRIVSQRTWTRARRLGSLSHDQFVPPICLSNKTQWFNLEHWFFSTKKCPIFLSKKCPIFFNENMSDFFVENTSDFFVENMSDYFVENMSDFLSKKRPL
jgi:hypothetical protein